MTSFSATPTSAPTTVGNFLSESNFFILGLAVALLYLVCSVLCFFACCCCVGNGESSEKRMQEHVEKKNVRLLANREREGKAESSLSGAEDSVLASAVRKGPFSFDDLVAVVFCSNGTVCSLTPRMASQLFTALDHNKQGTVDVDKLVQAATSTDPLFGIIATHGNDPGLGRLLGGKAAAVELLLDRLAGRKRTLDAGAWQKFTGRLRLTRTMVLKSTALSRGQLYFGKGVDGRNAWLPASGCFSESWVQDVAHFMRNQAHPILSVFFLSKVNAVTRFEQFLVALNVYMWMFLLTAVQFTALFLNEEHGVSKAEASVNRSWTTVWSSILIVVLPSLLVQNMVLKNLANASDVGISQQVRWRWAQQFKKRMKRSMLVAFTCFSSGMFFIGCLLSLKFSEMDATYEGRTISDFITFNLYYNFALAVFKPFVIQYNPSASVFRFCNFLKNVTVSLEFEAHYLVGNRVMVFPNGRAGAADRCCRCPCLASYPVAAELAAMGAGTVERVDEATSLCVVRLDKATSDGGGGNDEDDGGTTHVLLRPIHLASLDWIGRRARIVDGGASAPVGSILSFDGATGLYAVQLTSRMMRVSSEGVQSEGLRHVEPQFLKLVDDSSDEEAADKEEAATSNPDAQEMGPVVVPTLTPPAHEALSVSFAVGGSGGDSTVQTGSSVEGGSIDKAHLDQLRNLTLVDAKNLAEDAARRVVEQGRVAAAQVDRATRLAARQFANHPVGKVLGPWLGWLLLDALEVCGWQRQRKHALEIMRAAVELRGAEKMSDVDVQRIRDQAQAIAGGGVSTPGHASLGEEPVEKVSVEKPNSEGEKNI